MAHARLPRNQPKTGQGNGREPLSHLSAAQLGMYVALLSLTVLFVASLVAFLVIRAQNDVWRTSEMPPLPAGLLASSVLLVLVSGGLRWGLSGLRRNSFTTLDRGLLLAAVCAVAFLMAQIQNWRSMAAASLPTETRTLYAFTFYALTALHALHVLAGFVPLGIVIAQARRRQYSSSRSEGVRLCVQYWDFLLIVWFVLLAAITLAS